MSLAGVSLRDLEYVVAIAERGSFVGAAAQCGVSQPSLSAQIRKVEEWVGAPLFERTTRRVLLTADGTRFVAQARRVLAEARLLPLVVQSADKPFGGTLRLSAIATLGPYLFPLVLGDIRACYTEISLVLGEGLTVSLVAKLRDGELDAILVSSPIDDPALAIALLFREPFLLACPAGHGGIGTAEERWQALPAQERLLLEDGHCLRHQALAMCSDVGRRDRQATSLETLKFMVASGEGCTLVPALAVDQALEIDYSPLRSATFSREIALAWRRSDARQAQFQALALLLRDSAAAKAQGIVAA
jgi:LysR family hydrogen peroxide-inducible transcriptional activator